MSSKSFISVVLVAGAMLLAACTTPIAQLSLRDQLLITCDGLATTMGIVKNFILEGRINDPATLGDIRDASVIVEESCRHDPDYIAALQRLAAQSAILLEARMQAEAESGKGG
jgi:hypothetical protein